MKRATILFVVIAIVMYAVPTVLAQHGHGIGSGKSMGSTAATHSSHGTGGKSTLTPDQKIAAMPKLNSNLQKLLPAGVTPEQACTGFKNLGQCVAAIHVAHNLDIPFADLKAKMTGDSPVSLGKAIQTLAPKADATTEAQKGTEQAKEDLKSSS